MVGARGGCRRDALPMLIHTCINPHTTKVDSDCMADINHMGTCEFTQPSHTMKNTSKLWNSCNLCCVVTADPINGGVRFRNPVDSRCTMQTALVFTLCILFITNARS